MTPINYVIGDATKPQCAGPKIIAPAATTWACGVRALFWRSRGAGSSQKPNTAHGPDVWTTSPCRSARCNLSKWSPDIVVANIIGQHDTQFSCGVPPVRYFAITQGMIRIAEYALQRDASVHMPRPVAVWPVARGVVENIIRGTLSTADIRPRFTTCRPKPGAAKATTMNPYLILFYSPPCIHSSRSPPGSAASKRIYQRGYDTGWVDHQLEMARKDRERRDRQGRFRSLMRTTTKGGAR